MPASMKFTSVVRRRHPQPLDSRAVSLESLWCQPIGGGRVETGGYEIGKTVDGHPGRGEER